MVNSNRRNRIVDALLSIAAALPDENRLALSRSRVGQWARSIVTRLSIGEGTQSHRIVAGPLSGWQIVTDRRHYRGYLLGTYEPDISYILPSLIHPGMLVVDAGAHQGYFTLLLARLVGSTGRVLAFEPNKENLGLLQQSVHLNHVTHVSTYAWALSDRRGMASFSVGRSTSMGHIDVTVREEHAQMVQTITLDEFADAEALSTIHFIKMDVEGHEIEVLHGMTRVLAVWHPTLLCEFHSAELRAMGERILSEYGYHCTELGSSTMPHVLAR